MRTAFAAAFPLFAGQMYRALGTVGATLLLAGLTTAMAPLPYVHLLLTPSATSTIPTTFCISSTTIMNPTAAISATIT
jgi:hypothetical protein